MTVRFGREAQEWEKGMQRLCNTLAFVLVILIATILFWKYYPIIYYFHFFQSCHYNTNKTKRSFTTNLSASLIVELLCCTNHQVMMYMQRFRLWQNSLLVLCVFPFYSCLLLQVFGKCWLYFSLKIIYHNIVILRLTLNLLRELWQRTSKNRQYFNWKSKYTVDMLVFL